MINNTQLFAANYGNSPFYINKNQQQIQQPQNYPNNNHLVYKNLQNQKLKQNQHIVQVKNNPQYMNQVQPIKNAQNQYNLTNQNNKLGPGIQKINPKIQNLNNIPNQFRENNPTIPQNIQHLQAQKKQPIINPKDKQLLGANYLNPNQTHNLQTVSPNQRTHLNHHYQQQPQDHKNHHQHNIPQKQQNQILQKTNLEENLTNTIAVIPSQPIQNPNQQQKLKNGAPQENIKKSATLMTIKSLSDLPYDAYPKAEYSVKPFNNIAGYASNTYNGKAKDYNEDMLKVQIKDKGNLHISYFGVFDGHGGDKCSKFLKENMHTFLFHSKSFPLNPLLATRDAFKTAESEFMKKAIQNNKLVDRSGSCALISLIINNNLFSINLGDSRALYSRNAGKELYQISRDHKPNDPKEKARIEKAGGKVFYANKVTVNGKEVALKEEQFGKGFTFPYRLWPSGLAVSFFIKFFKVVRTIGDYYSKISSLGGKEGTNIYQPCVNLIQLDTESDFILLGCKIYFL